MRPSMPWPFPCRKPWICVENMPLVTSRPEWTQTCTWKGSLLSSKMLWTPSVWIFPMPWPPSVITWLSYLVRWMRSQIRSTRLPVKPMLHTKVLKMSLKVSVRSPGLHRQWMTLQIRVVWIPSRSSQPCRILPQPSRQLREKWSRCLFLQTLLQNSLRMVRKQLERQRPVWRTSCRHPPQSMRWTRRSVSRWGRSAVSWIS